MKKKQANPESEIGYKELEDGSLDWTTPNFGLHITNPKAGEQYEVIVFDSSKKNNDDAFIEAQGFDFWYEVLKYIEGWN